MGWDAFGLPAEQLWIQWNDPWNSAENTTSNAKSMRLLLLRLGPWSHYDDPNYYKWDAMDFLTKLYEKAWPRSGSACKLVEELEQLSPTKKFFPDGTSWAWWLSSRPQTSANGCPYRFTRALVDWLDELDWPEFIKDMQRTWIGKSTGANATFKVCEQTRNHPSLRLVQILGATFRLVLAPEHELVDAITTPEQAE